MLAGGCWPGVVVDGPGLGCCSRRVVVKESVLVNTRGALCTGVVERQSADRGVGACAWEAAGRVATRGVALLKQASALKPNENPFDVIVG